MATARDAAAALANIAKVHATREAKAPTGVVPGYNPKSGLTIGEDGRVLYAGAGGGGAASYYLTSGQSCTSGSFHAILWTTNAFTDATLYSMNAGTGVLTFNVAGHYWISARIQWGTNGTGVRQLGIDQLGSINDLIANDIRPALASFNMPNQCAGLALIAAGDTITVSGYQSSGGALFAENGRGYTNLFVMPV